MYCSSKSNIITTPFKLQLKKNGKMCYSIAGLSGLSVGALRHEPAQQHELTIGDPIREVPGSQRWLALFNKAQPPPLEFTFTQESTFNLHSFPTLLAQWMRFHPWNYMKKTASRTQRSAPCATSVCRARRGP